MRKKDYVSLANALRESLNDGVPAVAIRHIANRIADVLAANNRMFNRTRFLDYVLEDF